MTIATAQFNFTIRFSSNLSDASTFVAITICVSLCSILLVVYIWVYHLGRTILDRLSIVRAQAKKYSKISAIQWFTKTIFMNIFVYSFGIVVVQAAHVIARLTAATPCDEEIPKVLCVFRMIAAAISPSFVLLHVSITIQQALSTFRVSLRTQSIVARSCIFAAYCYVALYGYFVFRNEPLSGRTQLCSSFTVNSELYLIISLNLMMALEIVNLTFAIFLVVHNKKILKNERSSYSLSRTFLRMQNLYTMAPYIPVLALHAFVHFIVPYYCLIAPLAFLIMIKLGRFRRQGHMRNMIAPMQQSNAQEVYFNNLKEAWNKPLN
ncbi:hypothetical protein PRIPAC_96423 [Pristionchus pacificus]|uniref:Uncharacterized protein n=1 Tax=Pristionchus pacificus TaxID=54126 RepID=A0A2A6D2A3_PRIPA|nr:hypothetical protein PRIPAC_96423 [Pristionchus pacificus]|eukprot:PDM84437.1 hypothetical protein PRIPAC_33460 [Pristionchus pacificus]